MGKWYEWNGFRVELIESDEGGRYFRFELPIKEVYERMGSLIFLNERKNDYVPQPTGLVKFEDLLHIIPQEQDYIDYKALRKEYDTPEKQADEPEICNDYGNLSWEDRVIIRDGKKGLCDFRGNVLVPAIYDEVIGASFVFVEADDPKFLARAKKDGRWSLVRRDGKGTPVTGFVYDEIENDWGWYFAVRNEHAGILSSHSGKELVPCEMTRLFASRGGVSFFMKDDKWGFLSDELGYIAPEYDEFSIDTTERKTFDEGLYLKVRKGSVWGYIDNKGEFTQELKNACLDATLPDMRNSHRYFGPPLPAGLAKHITKMQDDKYRADSLLMQAELDDAVARGELPEDTRLPF